MAILQLCIHENDDKPNLLNSYQWDEGLTTSGFFFFVIVHNIQQIQNEIQQSLETMEKSAFPVKPGETFYLKVRLL